MEAHDVHSTVIAGIQMADTFPMTVQHACNIPAFICIVTMEMERAALFQLVVSSKRTAGLWDLLGMVYTWASQDSCTASYRLSIEPSYKKNNKKKHVTIMLQSVLLIS